MVTPSSIFSSTSKNSQSLNDAGCFYGIFILRYFVDFGVFSL